MDISKSIEAMLSEIRNYNGNFGDPIIEHVDFNPLDILESNNDDLAVGAGIALLVNFASETDNSTFSEAVTSQTAKDIKQAINRRFCYKYSSLFQAFKSALDAEAAFNKALNKVYIEYVE